MVQTWIPLKQRALVIRILTGQQAGRVFESRSFPVRVGTAPDNDLVLPDRTVSRRHLVVEHSVRGLLVRDLGSTNGTWVDGNPVREGFAGPDSVVTAGTVDLELRSAWRSPRVEEVDRFGELVARSPRGRLFLGAMRLAQGLRGPVSVWGEAGSGRRSAVRAMSRGTLALVSSDQGEIPDGLPLGSGTSDLLVMDPWLFSRAKQARLAALLEKVAGPVRIWSIWSQDPDLLLQRGTCLDRRLGEYLSQVVLSVPPVRDRPEDIELFLDEFVSARTGGPCPGWVKHWVRGMAWPGNWVELREAMEGLWRQARLFVLWPEVEMDPGREVLGRFREWKEGWVRVGDRLFTETALKGSRGNLSRAARRAGMDRKHLARLARRFGIQARGPGRPARSGVSRAEGADGADMGPGSDEWRRDR